ncbi:putative virulence factor [Xenorhabdus lircayensis]|uniref:Virulence factor n=1 Tax=Xenorhabdus lircayensis TaxID=2763499 RepID=A0ABS0U6S4_9GAMM|nr:virulence factor SrfC family protein [Xenorhabdus lircayensis]MBI6549580.1 putative virulence factor [Xenorhabdus lircayensis]
MNNLTPEQLKQAWCSVAEGAGQAIEWIEDARGNAPRLNTEADRLKLKLRRSRNTAQRLATAATRPMTIGFFGLSQAGKSYLISSLAAGKNGRLETQMGHHQLDFIEHINPPGGGKEATGLVTRFSRHASQSNPDWPIELQLFNEAEIAKILANAFIHDFNQEKIDWRYDEKRINALLASLNGQRQSRKVPGMTEDAVVALWDYLVRHAEKSQSKMALQYWPMAVELAPWLSIDDRAQLFGELWGNIREFSDVYRRFAHTLQRLGGAGVVRAPLSVLVTEQNGRLVQTNSIMNVDMLERLNKSNDVLVEVCPELEKGLSAPVSLSLAELTALTVELHVPLLSSTRERLFEDVDLLDFPGYRGRLGVESLNYFQNAAESEDSNPLAQLILRGKVAYLFERYTLNQEMNVLVVCTPSNEQSNVKDVGSVLDEWIRYTQGADAATRARRPSGLVWAITKLDLRITQELNKSEDMLREVWGQGGMVKITMTERFGHFPWMQEWQPGSAFNNTFLVRKPRQATPFIMMQADSEVEFNQQTALKLALMKKTFLEDAAIQRHIASPEEAWDAMLQLDDGGMRRLADYLGNVSQRDIKLARIAEQLDETRHELVEGNLHAWYQSAGAEEVGKKKQISDDILKALQNRAGMLGELLVSLVPQRKALQELYMQEAEVEWPTDDNKADESVASFGIGSDFDLFSDTPDETVSVHSHEQEFAHRVIKLWINYLRTVPEQPNMANFIGLPRSIVEMLVDELITVIQRMNVEGDLMKVLENTEQAGVRREKMMERQVSRVMHLMNDFITWLGYQNIPSEKRPASRFNKGQPIFARPDRKDPALWKGDERLYRLTNETLNYSAMFIFDWLIGLGEMIKENAGHSAGREITAAQNERLGTIIHRIQLSSE